MKLIHQILFFLLTLITAFINSVHCQTKNKPNIVLIIADDIGIGDIGFYHRERTGIEPLVPTPNIDQLVTEGIRFTDAHSPASLCAPTRFSMITGNFSFRNESHPWGVWNPETKAGIEPKFNSIAQIAKSGGYQTAFIGKWGLGGVWNDYDKKGEGYKKIDKGATYFGFDYALELPQGIQNKPFAFYENKTWMKLAPDSELAELTFEQTGYEENERMKKREGLGDSNWDPSLAGSILANKAVDYIGQRDKDKPFFLYYCTQAVHLPHTPSNALNGVKIAGTTFNNHGDMIKELDTQVGMIINALKKQDLYSNTLIVFTSDNGGLDHFNENGHDSSNGFSGSKGSILEGGHRVPFIAVWKENIESNSQSEVSIVGHDMVATVAELAGVKTDLTQVLDAANLIPIFKNQKDRPVHDVILHQSQSNGRNIYALRQDDWKLVIETDKKEDFENANLIGLYNLKENKIEDKTTNLISRHEHQKHISNMFSTYKKYRLGSIPTTTKP